MPEHSMTNIEKVADAIRCSMSRSSTDWNDLNQLTRLRYVAAARAALGQHERNKATRVPGFAGDNEVVLDNRPRNAYHQ